MRLPLVALLLFALPAVAQTGTAVNFTTTSTSNNNTVVTSRDECTTTLRFSWSRTGTLCNGGTVYLYVTSGSCGGLAPVATDLTLDTVTGNTTTSGVVSFSMSQVLARQTGAPTCATQEKEVSFKLCAITPTISDSVLQTCSATYSSIGAPAFTLTYDPEAPSAPSIGKVIARDSALSVQVDNVEEDSNVIIELNAILKADAGIPEEDAGTDADAGTDDAGTVADAGTTPVGESEGPTLRFNKAAGEGNVVATGLINGVTYRIRAKLEDEAGNVSEASAVVEGTPVKSNGLFDAYKDANGQEQGGCASTGGGLAGGAVLAALGIWLSSRRKVS
ncbi:hypothetical protein D7Y13_15810 [Corallococcus praedator]|uniref:Fibronectin type III domain-containing protein n=1 Tax=Corallococcus praedator TaxID=2316724 RepID=A0ABX9QKJ9_9BACT|nr:MULTISPECIES: MXAN_2561 family MXYO-CTERM-anchored protein [Corallococcus]RKH32306.1 hypothetical protein D7X75_16315 [Corallococcus sp. CA031C]RKI08556.1 hypothetical protein D7Y13_15810 [Corallococcus praedator]